MYYLRMLSVLPLFAVSLWAAPSVVDELVLPEKIYPQLDAILKHAVERSPQMISRGLDLEMAENSRIEARAGLLPMIAGTYGISKSRDRLQYIYPGSSGIPDRSNSYTTTRTPYNISVTQPVFMWGDRRRTAQIGKIQETIAAGNYRDGYRMLAQAIRAQFLQLIVQKNGVKRAKLANQYNHELLALAEDRLAKKVISEAEIFGVRLSAERSDIDQENAEYGFETAKSSFARLTGGNLLEDNEIPDDVAPIEYSPEAIKRLLGEFLDQKEPKTFQAESLRSQIKIAELTYLNQKTRLRPKLSANIGASQSVDQNYFGQDVTYSDTAFYGGINVNWTIFDGLAAGAGRRNALIRLRQAETRYREFTEQLARDAQNDVKLIDFSARNMKILERVLDSTAGGFKVKQADFERGVVSENEITQGQIGVQDARIAAENARIDLLTRIGDFLGTIAADPVLANLPEKP